MSKLVLGALFGAGLTATVAWWGGLDPAHAQRTSLGAETASGLITLTSPVDEHRQQLTLIDPRTRVAGVYHIDRDTGEISLKSVRNVNWDLHMEEFNSASPRPREIRAMLDQQ